MGRFYNKTALAAILDTRDLPVSFKKLNRQRVFRPKLPSNLTTVIFSQQYCKLVIESENL
jgi:hypothetical protein